MKHSFSLRGRVRLISFGAAVLLALSGCILSQHVKLADARRHLANEQQHAFAELTNAMEEMDTSLQKGLYASSPSMLNTLSVDLYGKANAAQMAIGEIPFAHVDLAKTSDFIARVGDYALSLSKRNFSQNALTEAERKNLRTLRGISEKLSNFLNETQAQINQGVLTLESFEAARDRLAQMETETLSDSSTQGLKEMELEFPELPTLIYDGPFSAHAEQRTPAYLSGKSGVSQVRAQQAAEQMLGISGLQADGACDGTIPTYRFFKSEGDRQTEVQVTRTGGLVQRFSVSRPIVSAERSGEECVELAKAFLNRNGYSNMKESYYTTYGGAVTINFAALQNGVICYPDLVKVAVAQDTGEIIGFDATGYLMCHTVRTIPAPSVSAEAASANLSKDLSVLSHDLAIIRTAGEAERFCHEFKCETPDGQHYIFYLNAENGEEERILILLEDETGTLTL